MGLFNRLFGGGKKLPRSKQGGHRGVALGIGSKPDTTTVPGRTLNRQQVGNDEVRAFLEDGAPLFVHSSNHAMAQYFPLDQKLTIEYLDGEAYAYGNVSPEEALEYAQAHSKGAWGIDHLIGRENLKGHAHWHGGPSLKPVTRLR